MKTFFLAFLIAIAVLIVSDIFYYVVTTPANPTTEVSKKVESISIDDMTITNEKALIWWKVYTKTFNSENSANSKLAADAAVLTCYGTNN